MNQCWHNPLAFEAAKTPNQSGLDSIAKSKISFLFSWPKHMYGYSKETSQWAPKTHVNTDGLENILLCSNFLFIRTSGNVIKVWCIFFQIRCLSEDKKHNCSMVAGGDTERAVVKKLLEDQTYRIQMAAITSHGVGEWSKLYIVGKWFLCKNKKQCESWWWNLLIWLSTVFKSGYKSFEKKSYVLSALISGIWFAVADPEGVQGVHLNPPPRPSF